jgi:hypothetical protein
VTVKAQGIFLLQCHDLIYFALRLAGKYADVTVCVRMFTCR